MAAKNYKSDKSEKIFVIKFLWWINEFYLNIKYQTYIEICKFDPPEGFSLTPLEPKC